MSLYNFYRSKEWTNLLEVIKLERLVGGELLCECCGKPIVNKYDCIGHHTIYLTEANYTDASISLNPDLIMLVHHSCHNRIHDKLGYTRQREVYLVYGSPLSGKTTWVKDNMSKGDLIIDIDNIWECVSGCDRYTKPNRLNAIVFSVRDNLLEAVRYRRGKWFNAYVVGGYPYAAERERLVNTLGAREIYIDTSEAECIKRLENCEDGRDKAEWGKYISDWFKQFNGGY